MRIDDPLGLRSSAHAPLGASSLITAFVAAVAMVAAAAGHLAG